MLVSDGCRSLYAGVPALGGLPTFGAQFSTFETMGWQLTDVTEDGALNLRRHDTDPDKATILVDITSLDAERIAAVLLVVPPSAPPGSTSAAHLAYDGGPSLPSILALGVAPLAIAAPTSSELALLSATEASNCRIDWFTPAGQPIRTIDVCVFDEDEKREAEDLAADGLGGLVVSGPGTSALALAFDAGGDLRWRIDADDLFAASDESFYDTQVVAAPRGDVLLIGRIKRATADSIAWVARISSEGDVLWHATTERGAEGSTFAVARAIAANDDVIWVSGYSTAGSTGEPTTWLRAYTP